MPGFGNDRLKFGGVKLSFDGQFPARGSLMSEPYLGTEQTGVARVPSAELKRLVALAHANGIRFCIHAYGDRARDEVLDAFENAQNQRPDIHLRHRLEHGGNVVCSRDDIERMKRLDVTAVPNASFLRSRGRMALPWLGETRGRDIVVVKDLIEAGCPIAVGSDWPGLQFLSPLAGMESLVTRRTAEGILVSPDQAIDAETALRLYTVNNAYIGYEEKQKGSLECGKFADLVVLADDPIAVAPAQIASVGVEATISQGRAVYARDRKALGLPA
jgi:predicted amidohydrolase YtcJ